jgi:hypothetical protein
MNAACAVLAEVHPNEKVLIFTQFADTVRYLTAQLKARGVAALDGVTGASPTALAWRFSCGSSQAASSTRHRSATWR